MDVKSYKSIRSQIRQWTRLAPAEQASLLEEIVDHLERFEEHTEQQQRLQNEAIMKKIDNPYLLD